MIYLLSILYSLKSGLSAHPNNNMMLLRVTSTFIFHYDVNFSHFIFHQVLWPECGWQPVSLTDLIMGASVKKVYRKATLCIHPDKVQQKGANLQQKYIAEKVFDLLKEAWNKFNSEELF